MIGREGEGKTGSSDEPTIHWWAPSVYPIVKWNKTPFNTGWTDRSLSVHPATMSLTSKDVLAAETLAPDDMMRCWMKCWMKMCQQGSTVRFGGRQQLVAPDEPTSWKSIALDHPTVPRKLAVGATTLWEPWSIYTPSTQPFEVAGMCGSTEESKTHWRSFPRHPSAKLPLLTCTCFVYVCSDRLSLVLSWVQGVPTLWGDSRVNQVYKVHRKPWGL
jgi:hypothetical protein